MTKLLALFNPFAELVPVTTTHHFSAYKNLRTATKYWLISLVALNIALALIYSFSINSAVVNGYNIKSLQNKITAAQQQYNKLTVEVAQVNSLQVQQEFVQANFVPAGTPVYMTNSTPQFTQR